MVVAPVEGSAGAGPASHCRSLVSRRMLAPSRGASGRPFIDSSCRDLIRRMAAENYLWGAPRIHGELLKLGIAISERTVSRYLRGRPPTRSQTWRTFFANHLGGPMLTSPLMFADARDDDDVADSSDLSSRPTETSINGCCVSARWAVVDCGLPLQPAFLGMRLRQGHLRDCAGPGKSTGRDPPPHPWLQLPRRPATGAFRVCLLYFCDRTAPRAILSVSSLFLPAQSSRQRRRRRLLVQPATQLLVT